MADDDGSGFGTLAAAAGESARRTGAVAAVEAEADALRNLFKTANATVDQMAALERLIAGAVRDAASEAEAETRPR